MVIYPGRDVDIDSHLGVKMVCSMCLGGGDFEHEKVNKNYQTTKVKNLLIFV